MTGSPRKWHSKEPALRIDVELGDHHAFAVVAALGRGLGDAVEHQHRRQRQLRVARAVQATFARGDQVFIAEGGGPAGLGRHA
jgi:hypothetical protein